MRHRIVPASKQECAPPARIPRKTTTHNPMPLHTSVVWANFRTIASSSFRSFSLSFEEYR